ncbi:synaptonemal complex protein 3-like [Mytilus galloprovincialis]|uniref:synaptonemal complex protein 3-like n=1 Tax=Mytilus galloprovincialis TaxID=29158 RepID=UPI003F7BC447
MPKAQKRKADGNQQLEQGKQLIDDDNNGSESSQSSSPIRDETPIIPRKKKNEGGPDEDVGQEMQKMLECFGADITKTMVAKRKRLEQLTQNSLKNTNKKVEDIWTTQKNERVKLQDEYNRQISNVLGQWESDIEKTKEQEEKLTLLFKQQQKLFQQARVVQSQRLKTVQQLHEQYSKGIGDLDNCHQSQHSTVQSEMKKEMSLLQKRILMDTQQQEMANVRKSLQTMLF